MTDAQRAVIAGSDMTVQQQQQIPFTERRVAATEKNAESSRIRANRAPAPRAPRSQTELEYYQELSNIPAAQRTPEQKAFMDKYTRSGRGGNSRSIPDSNKIDPERQSRFRRID